MKKRISKKRVSLLLFAVSLSLPFLWAKNPNEAIQFGSQGQPLVVPDAVTQLSNAVSRVAEKVSPHVVSIHSEKVTKVQPYQYFNPFEDFFNSPFSQRSPYRQRRPQNEFRSKSLGSGVIVSSQGHILTNNHVVSGADSIRVTLSDDREFEAEIIGTDQYSDVAVIRIKEPPKDLPVALLGNSDRVRVGEFIVAIGNPFDYSGTVTSGIISAKGRTAKLSIYENYLQIDAAINPGNSGGALVNLKGEVIGINTAIASRSGGSNGIGFAIPINMAKGILEDIVNNGKVRRGYLGVYLQDLDAGLRSHFGLDQKGGAMVQKVIKDSPAEEAGLQAQDVVLKVNGQKVKDMNDLRNLVARLKPGHEYQFEVVRNSKIKTLKVQLGERPDQLTGSHHSEKVEKNWGLELQANTSELSTRYRLNRTDGVVVTRVEVRSPAQRAGLQEGDLIIEVGNNKVNSPRGVKRFLSENRKSHLLLVERGGAQVFIALRQ